MQTDKRQKKQDILENILKHDDVWFVQDAEMKNWKEQQKKTSQLNIDCAS